MCLLSSSLPFKWQAWLWYALQWLWMLLHFCFKEDGLGWPSSPSLPFTSFPLFPLSNSLLCLLFINFASKSFPDLHFSLASLYQHFCHTFSLPNFCSVFRLSACLPGFSLTNSHSQPLRCILTFSSHSHNNSSSFSLFRRKGRKSYLQVNFIMTRLWRETRRIMKTSPEGQPDGIKAKKVTGTLQKREIYFYFRLLSNPHFPTKHLHPFSDTKYLRWHRQYNT